MTHPGTRLNPHSDRVCVNDRAIQSVDRQTYILLHKPPGYLVSARDPHHAQTIYKLLRGIDARVFPVGRLDLDTRGVLLLMDDGDLAFRLTHPRYGVKKVYRAWVSGHPSEAVLTGMREGMKLSDGVTAPAHIRIMRARGGDTELELVLHEGRKRTSEADVRGGRTSGAIFNTHAFCRSHNAAPQVRPMAASDPGRSKEAPRTGRAVTNRRIDGAV